MFYTELLERGQSPGLGVLFAMLCMIGIEAAACFSAETRNPETSVKRATYIAIVFLAVFYALGAWAYIISQGGSQAIQAATSDPVGSFFASLERSLGKFVVTVFSLTVVTSQMIAINAIQGSASRYLFALGRSRILPSQLALVHSRLQSPWVAVLLEADLANAGVRKKQGKGNVEKGTNSLLDKIWRPASVRLPRVAAFFRPPDFIH